MRLCTRGADRRIRVSNLLFSFGTSSTFSTDDSQPETPRHSKQDDKIYREQNSGSGLQDALILECGSFIKAYKRGSVGDNLCLGRATKN